MAHHLVGQSLSSSTDEGLTLGKSDAACGSRSGGAVGHRARCRGAGSARRGGRGGNGRLRFGGGLLATGGGACVERGDDVIDIVLVPAQVAHRSAHLIVRRDEERKGALSALGGLGDH